MTPVIHFVSGLPRSGSTLLVNLLAQHPQHYVTATSGVAALYGAMQEHQGGWSKWEAFKAQGVHEALPRVASAFRGLAYGYYASELSAGQIVFDKNRAWTQHVEFLEQVFDRPVRIIFPVRDVRAIVASFERRYRANPLVRGNAGPTVEARARNWTQGKLIGAPIAFLRDAIARNVENRLILVPYRQLCREPQLTLGFVHQCLDLPPFVYDPENVEQVTEEDDSERGWGPGLHTIRSRVEPPSDMSPWEGVLPPQVAQRLAVEFADINALAIRTIEREGEGAA